MRERRITLVVLAAASLTVGVWALFAPQSFYRSFPFGRGWVALDGPYNEHLIGDVGAMNLALATVTMFAAWRMRADVIRLADAATLIVRAPPLRLPRDAPRALSDRRMAASRPSSAAARPALNSSSAWTNVIGTCSRAIHSQ